MSIHWIRRSLLASTLFGCAAMGVGGAMAVDKNRTKSKVRPAQAPLSQTLRDYRRWPCVNPQPLFVPDPTAALCAAPAPIQRGPSNPHEGKHIRVYVNGIGRRAMMEMKTPRFPMGSVIVKEKLPTNRSKTPELLTVMVKRSAGFDSKNGDWEYLVADGSGTKIQRRGRIAHCQSCHVPQKANGYVFRDYLPDEVEQRLH